VDDEATRRVRIHVGLKEGVDVSSILKTEIVGLRARYASQLADLRKRSIEDRRTTHVVINDLEFLIETLDVIGKP